LCWLVFSVFPEVFSDLKAYLGAKMNFLYLGTSVAVVFLSACATNDRVSLVADKDQQSLTRNGVSALISRKKNLVMLRPVSKTMRSSARPAFVVAIRNMGNAPLELRVAGLRAELVTGKARNLAMRIYSYEQLVAEAEDDRNTRLFLAALGGAASAMSAANAGYTQTTGHYSGSSYGAYPGSFSGTYSATTYDPYRAQAAQQAASAQTAANIDAIQAEGEANLAMLERTVIKDHTLLPGEWFGGSIVLEAPQKTEAGRAEYLITVALGGDDYTFRAAQAEVGN
jgi:hypothetical protein